MLSEFMLPPLNVLLRTYLDLHTIMKDIGMEYQAIHACPNDDILSYREHASNEKCPKCEESRYRSDRVTKIHLTI